MHTLIIGGTKGLGLEVARLYVDRDEQVTVTGRQNPDEVGVDFYAQDLTDTQLAGSMEKLLTTLPKIDRLIYNAGILHEDHLTGFSEHQIKDMVSIGLLGLLFAARAILEKQGTLPELVTVTSTSQFTAREKESTYNAVKAGAAHFTHGLSLDKRVGKAVVIAPAGMATSFYDGSGRDLSEMMNPKSVAPQFIKIIDEAPKDFSFALIMRSPNRVYTGVPTHGDLIRHITTGEPLDLARIKQVDF